MNIDEFAAEFASARPQGGGYRVRCPAHDDRQASLMIHTGRTGNLVLKCHAGCETAEVLAALGKSFADLRGEPEARVMPMRRSKVAEYVYTDAHGEYLYKTVRTEPKGFYAVDIPAAQDQRVLYRLPDIARAKECGLTVYVVEGEKDADTLDRRGLVATCNAGGAGKFYPHYAHQLAGVAKVVVIADDDKAGRPHARAVGAMLAEAGLDVRVALPAAGCKDVTEHLAAGHTLSELRPLPSVDSDRHLGWADLDAVAMRPIQWAWRRHFAVGALTYLEGDPGVSKSTVSCDLAARFSRGEVMPDGSPNCFGGAVAVVMVTAEDSIASTMTPRLYAAGADLRRVKAVTSAAPESDEPFSLEEHVDRLRHDVQVLGAKVVIIDPLSAFLGSKVDTFKDSAVRAALLPLARLAEELDVCVLVVRHFNKSSGGKAIHKGGGSIGFIGAARAAFQMSHHPEEEGVCIFTNAKNNLAKSQPSLTYRIVADERIRAVDPEFEIGRIEWLGVSGLDAQEVLDTEPGEGGRAHLAEYGKAMVAAVEDGPKTWATIGEILAKDGFSARTVERYRSRYLESVRLPGEGNRGTLWRAKGSTHAAAQATPHPTAQALRSAQSTSDQPTPPRTHDSRDEMPRCDVCGGPGGFYWPAPHFITACKEHNPITGGGAR